MINQTTKSTWPREVIPTTQEIQWLNETVEAFDQFTSNRFDTVHDLESLADHAQDAGLFAFETIMREQIKRQNAPCRTAKFTSQ